MASAALVMSLLCALLLLCGVSFSQGLVAPSPARPLPSASPSAPLPINATLAFVRTQYDALYLQWVKAPSGYPWWASPAQTTWHTIDAKQDSFTNGFFPGQFAYLYEHSRDPSLLQQALTTTLPLQSISTHTSTHDIGFVIMASFGHLHRLTHNASYVDVIRTSALSLASRYSPIVHCTRSWNSDSPTFEVIIDNVSDHHNHIASITTHTAADPPSLLFCWSALLQMMNLELLWYASLMTGNRTWADIALAHANRTMHEHVREDNSTWHVVVYDEKTGAVMKKVTNQGYSDNSTWSRGQSWGVYGFTMAYRFTGHAPFLRTAQRLADYFLHHLHLESPDSVPYWDFLAPLSNYQPRDTSAGAIVSSGLLELSRYVPAAEGARYVAEAEMILGNLTSPSSPYFVQNLPTVELPAVLVNGTTGPWHGFNSTAPFNVAEAYADYYLTEALSRLLAIQQGRALPNINSTDAPAHTHISTPPITPTPAATTTVTVNWTHVTSMQRTVPTLQMVVHPLLTRASPIHDASFASLAALYPSYPRLASWFPFPRLSVPSLSPPSGLHQCGNVGVGYDVHLSCERGGGVIDQVEFASFGLPDGVCGGFTRSRTCDAANSSAVVESLCLGKRNCTVPANSALFGTPCPSSALSTRLAVQVTCDPPQNNTYWDFQHLDPLVDDFMTAIQLGSPVMNFCTMPSWLFVQEAGQPVHYAPDNPVGTDWGYETGTKLVDPTCEQAGAWYGRLAAWYINGGMVDEYGVEHVSGHRYPIHLWEVLNEVLHEHAIDIHTYICLYDAIVHAVRAAVDPKHVMLFVGMAYANVDVERYDDFRTFLNHSNHRPGTPLDAISYVHTHTPTHTHSHTRTHMHSPARMHSPDVLTPCISSPSLTLSPLSPRHSTGTASRPAGQTRSCSSPSSLTTRASSASCSRSRPYARSCHPKPARSSTRWGSCFRMTTRTTRPRCRRSTSTRRVRPSPTCSACWRRWAWTRWGRVS